MKTRKIQTTNYNRKLTVRLYVISSGIYSLTVVWVTLSYIALTKFGTIGILLSTLMALIIWLLIWYLLVTMVKIYEKRTSDRYMDKGLKKIVHENVIEFCIVTLFYSLIWMLGLSACVLLEGSDSYLLLIPLTIILIIAIFDAGRLGIENYKWSYLMYQHDNLREKTDAYPTVEVIGFVKCMLIGFHDYNEEGICKRCSRQRM